MENVSRRRMLRMISAALATTTFGANGGGRLAFPAYTTGGPIYSGWQHGPTCPSDSTTDVGNAGSNCSYRKQSWSRRNDRRRVCFAGGTGRLHPHFWQFLT